jgi:hypothetical protein
MITTIHPYYHPLPNSYVLCGISERQLYQLDIDLTTTLSLSPPVYYHHQLLLDIAHALPFCNSLPCTPAERKLQQQEQQRQLKQQQYRSTTTPTISEDNSSDGDVAASYRDANDIVLTYALIHEFNHVGALSSYEPLIRLCLTYLQLSISQVNPIVFFDIAIHGHLTGRLTFELFERAVPATTGMMTYYQFPSHSY